jgi:hypothetical protein
MNATGTVWPGLLALDLSVLLPGLYLAGALLVGAAVIALASRWRKRTAGGGEDASHASDQLAHFRSLYERGAISQEEYNRLRALLSGQLREALEVPPPPTAEPRPPAPAPPPAVPPPPGGDGMPSGGGEGGIRPG